MKNLLKLLCLVSLLSSACTNQMIKTLERRGKLVKDTIHWHDTITVHDTIHVHDTIRIAGSSVKGSKDLDSLNEVPLVVENDDVKAVTTIRTDSLTGKKTIQTTVDSKEKRIIYDKDVVYNKKIPYQKDIPVLVPCLCPEDPPFWKKWWIWVIAGQSLIIFYLIQRRGAK